MPSAPPQGLLPLLLPIALVALPACAGGYVGDYERCLHGPDPHYSSSRPGQTVAGGGVSWLDWDGRGVMHPAPVLSLTMSVQDCLYSVRAEEGQQSRWSIGGFTAVNGMSFHQDRSGRRVGFVGTRPGGVHAVVDGVVGPAFKDISLPPLFSPNGQHVAYLAREASGGVLVVDGQVAGRARSYDRDLLVVLDDGRVAVAAQRADGMYEVTVGEVRSPPVLELCDSDVLPSGRFAFVGKRGEGFVTFVDGREVDAPGLPAGCDVTFSADEQRWGYIAVHTGPGGMASEEGGAVVDGKFYPLDKNGADVRFVHGLAVVRTLHADPSGYTIHGARKYESVHWLVEVPTPEVAPSEDAYSPVDNGGSVEWARVKLGDSVGPRFDTIDMASLFVDEAGRVHYAGTRGGTRIAVVDNVIVPPARRAIAVPETPAASPQ